MEFEFVTFFPFQQYGFRRTDIDVQQNIIVLSLLNGHIINQIYQKIFDYISRQSQSEREGKKETLKSHKVSREAIRSGLNCGDTMTKYASNGMLHT